MLANLEKKQLSMAKLVALRALKIDENDPELYHTIGLILLQENEPAKARLQFLKAAEVRPDYQPAQVMLAKIALQAEDYVGAEEHLRRILQADGKNAQAMVDLGVAYKGQGQYDKAMQAYDAAEKLNPKLASVWFNRAVILGDQKKEYPRAIELFKKFVSVEGGENAVPADHAVFEQIKINEQRIAKAEADKAAAEELKRAEAEALKQAEQMEKEAAAAAKAEEDAKKAEEDAKKGGGKDVKAASGKDGSDVKPAVEEKKEEKKKEQPAAAPEVKKEAAKKVVTPPAKTTDEPTDEPTDGL
jgi:Flp pilus assembly protein TadD